MATIAQSVNVIAPLMTTPVGIWKQTTYFPLLLFSKYMRGKSVAVHVRTGTYQGKTFPEWVETTCTVPKLDVSAAIDANGWMNLAVVNLDEAKSFSTQLSSIKKGVEVQVFTVGGDKFVVTDTNSPKDEKVSIIESKWVAIGDVYTFERLSFTLLRWKTSVLFKN
ncbi:alpha-L-arabinofuranosidase [Ilyonectria robusta]|uniref:alpha-L-arabinofuranosidase n=1 Tax=Ilyonectria robusta TaxID=1079257 RepID=UPI001E8D9319|nr:alpha-L-arabinofuranosidase [Ilyonectria robusta]KAH8646533.1 alpha-L-arabinofuranosidase [Ilyonectria robusta]